MSVVCGQSSTFAITESGKVFSWGFNGNGQLGIGTTVDQALPSLVAELDDYKISQVSISMRVTSWSYFLEIRVEFIFHVHW